VAPQTKIAPELLRAIAHPQRLAILTALEDRAMSVPALVTELASDRATVARHLRSLERAGLVRSAAVGNDLVFETVALPRYDNAEWSTLSDVVRREALATALTRVQVATTTSLDDGGFDRENIHFSRTSLTIGEADFDKLSANFDAMLDRVDEVQTEATEGTVQATAVLMLFESTPSGDHQEAPREIPARFTVDEGRERAYDLHERIGDLVLSGNVDWDAALDAVDELRVVLNASRLAAQRESQGAIVLPGPHAHATPAT
jgi:DNA-binding transcriptional ArsR family regulator